MNEFVFNRYKSHQKKGRYFHSKKTFFDYYWIPALNWNPETYTLIYFLGYDGELPLGKSQHRKYNTLLLVDRSGPSSKGSWFFGESGDPLTLNFLMSFLKQFTLAGLFKTEKIIFSGKGMGGHMALYCQQIMETSLSVVHNPTTNLIDSKYYLETNKNIFKNIFDLGNPHEMQDIIRLISASNVDHQQIVLTSNRPVNSDFFKEQILPLVECRQTSYVGEEQLYFGDIFQLMDEYLEQKNDKYTVQSIELPKIEGDPLPISIQVSSRPSIEINQDFSFCFDPYEDRSWRFWFQNLSWLEGHLDSLNEESRTEQFDKIIFAWMQHIDAKNNNDDEFFYHDHSLAYRAMHLINCRKYASKHTVGLVDQHIADIGSLLISPLEDNSLSNHAYDQAIALFLIAYQLPFEDSRKVIWEAISLERIERELSYSFTEDGVHVENSPSYHHGMITNIHKSLTKVLKITEHSKIRQHLANLNRSVPYLTWIIRPDGKVPAIGDSEEKQVSTGLARRIAGENFQPQPEGMKVFGKGYAVWRSDPEAFHMTLKSCQHGRFHRHDDDCSLTLWHRGKNLLHDAGLLYYKEKDEMRIFVRSPSGHSGFEIPKVKPIRNMLDRGAQRANVSEVSDMTAISELGMYSGVEIQRKVQTDYNKIVIEDEFCDLAIKKEVQQNFLISNHWNIEITEEQINLTDEDYTWSFQFTDKQHLASLKTEKIIVSKLKNEVTEGIKLSFSPKTNNSKILIVLNERSAKGKSKSAPEKVPIYHEKFGKLELTFPIDWSMNPYESKNWMHHLNSLRWLKEGKEIDSVIRDFYTYHFTNKKRHPYFNTRAGDHTISIRLIKCCEIYANADKALRLILEKIMMNDISSLMNESVYRSGHNHGLMADVSLLQAYKKNVFCKKNIDKITVKERAEKTLSTMFFPSGLTKEHSLSYQLWNLNYALEFLDESEKTPNKSKINLRETYLNFSKEFLDHFMYDEQYQFPLGDSFRMVNKSLYNKLFSAANTSKSDVYFNNQFASLRYRNSFNQNIHIAMTSGFNSHIHKQDDDLSFCLAVNGKVVFDDSGYTDTATKEEYEFLSSTDAHSIMTVVGFDFSKEGGIGDSLVHPIKENKDGSFVLSGIHKRIPGVTVKRELLATDKSVTILDHLSSECIDSSTIIRRRFVINPSFKVEINNNDTALIVDGQGQEIFQILCTNSNFKLITEGITVGLDKRNLRPINGLDIYGTLADLSPIILQFSDPS